MTPGRTLQRVVLPLGLDPDVLPLYVEVGAAGAPRTAEATPGPAREQHPENVMDRRRLRIEAGSRASFATYFNAFPASYWRRWTIVEEVELAVRVSGPATVAVYRSTATGTTERVTTSSPDPAADGPRDLSFRLTLKPFADGGWYWFDVIAGRQDVVLEQSQWRVAAVAPGTEHVLDEAPGSLTIAITTFNRPAYLLDLLRQLGDAPDTLDVVDEVVVVDQGTQKVRDQSAFDEATAGLGARLRVLEQANVGGSGGFARGMSETLRSGRSRYVLLLDDDVSSEPESVLRGAVFADLCRTPTIVGGHMFSLYARASLHSMGEVVKRWRFWWQQAPHVWTDHDFSTGGLRDTRWLHRRVDVDYNGWWMCLIPVEVLKTIGLSLPLFIKWDDAEYGLRAGKAGYPTVSLPGMAIWHVPWTEKDDALDWQAYYHQRNRLVAALLHSPHPRGGRLVRESFNHQVKHLLAMQYSVADLRLRAIEDVLSGPGHLHRSLATTLPEVRALRATYPDAQGTPDPTAFPPVLAKPRRKDREPAPPRGLRGMVTAAAAGAVRQLRPVPETARQHPQDRVPAMDAAWWRLSALDSAVVSTTDGTSAAWYQRDRSRFTELMARSVRLHERLALEWPQLAAQYRASAPGLVSPQQWAQTFDELERARG
jgi:galactofuranosylgalactofuranosylrhamnosyl-N-acetylglucosaminyl-diphospho-decaprenol beta-1,5/1,6-galactofuranosyltransferase